MGSNLRLSRVLERKIDFHLMMEIGGQIDQIQWWNKKHAFIIHTYRSNQGRYLLTEKVVRAALLPGSQAAQLLHGALRPADVRARLIPDKDKYNVA